MESLPITTAEPNARSIDRARPVAVTHPEEMLGDVELRVGGNVVLRARGRATPAGFATLGVLAALVILSSAVLVRTLRGAAG